MGTALILAGILMILMVFPFNANDMLVNEYKGDMTGLVWVILGVILIALGASM